MIFNIFNSIIKAGVFCLFALLCLELPVTVNAQPDNNSQDLADIEVASSNDHFTAQKSPEAKVHLWHRLEDKWTNLSTWKQIITLGSSIILCLVFMVIFWLVHPYTVAPIEFLLNSFLAMLLSRFLSTIFGGAIGFALPFIILMWSGEDEGIKAGTDISYEQAPDEERSNGVLPEDNREPKHNSDPDRGMDGGERELDIRIDNRLSEVPRSQNMVESNNAPDSKTLVTLKLAELQGSLALVNSKIESERKRWLDANAIINALTNNKTTPVVRNSQEHVRMYEAQVIMKQVEKGAPSLKAEKGRLEAMIKSLHETVSSSAP